MKPHRPRIAIVSGLCSAPAVILGIWAVGLYYFAPTTKAHSEDVLGLAVVSLWLSPLVIAAVTLALFARGFRLPCTVAALAPLLCWGAIILNEGGLR